MLIEYFKVGNVSDSHCVFFDVIGLNFIAILSVKKLFAITIAQRAFLTFIIQQI